MKKIQKFLTLLLVVCIAMNTVGTKYIAKAEEYDVQTVYVDGVEYKYYFEGENFYLKCLDEDAVLEMDVNGEADVSIGNDEYTVEFEELSDTEIDATVYDEEGDKIEEYTDVDEIVSDDYTGQEAITWTITAFTIGALVKVLIELAVTFVVAGVTCWAVSAVYTEIKEDQQKKKYYYKAYFANEKESVFIDYGSNISKEKAVTRIQSGKNIYTWTSSQAKAAVDVTGMGCITQSEITLNATALFGKERTMCQHNIIGLQKISDKEKEQIEKLGFYRLFKWKEIQFFAKHFVIVIPLLESLQISLNGHMNTTLQFKKIERKRKYNSYFIL